jgi:membrane protein DedA with SNARE-associated domain
LRWSLFTALLLGFILVPFVLFEDPMNAAVQEALRSQGSVALVTLAVVACLLADIALPIPSSFVLATAGFLLGAGLGTLVCFVGLSCASLAGYAIGRYAGEPLARRIVGADQLARFGALSRRHGDAVLVAFRAMPVLAEASTILAGTARMALPRFVVLVSIGNAVVAALYACIGAWSASQASFVAVSLAAMVLPVLIVLIGRRFVPPAAGASGPARP